MGNEIIAYAGQVIIDKVVWDNVWGQYVQLKLEQRAHEKTTANPFKKFTKMKKDRVGTRFGAVFTDADGDVFYQDEVMLKHWGDGVTGWSLHLWVNPDSDGFHPFMDKSNGDTLAMALVELDDDNTAIDQVKREKVETGPKTRQEMKLSNYAAMLCRLDTFREYMGERENNGGPWSEQHCANWMREYLGIASRAQLDTDNHVAAQFHTEIRQPYAHWVGARP